MARIGEIMSDTIKRNDDGTITIKVNDRMTPEAALELTDEILAVVRRDQ